MSRSLGIHLALFTNAEVTGTLNFYFHAGDLKSVQDSYPVQSKNNTLLDSSLDGHKWRLRFQCGQTAYQSGKQSGAIFLGVLDVSQVFFRSHHCMFFII